MDRLLGVVALFLAAALFVGGVLGVWYLYKSVQVWGAEMSGRAVLAEAEFSRQARVEEAKAKEAAAKLEGQAELTRAEYSARANEALADGLGGPEAYLRYLYIRMLEEQSNDGTSIIYIPTEAGIPILEAGKLVQPTVTGE